MLKKAFRVQGGKVWIDRTDNGTTRPTWRAYLYTFSDAGVAIRAEGDGKAPHVALNRAATQLCNLVERDRKRHA